MHLPAGSDVLVLVACEDDQQGLAAANEAGRGAGRVDRCSVHYWILCYANIIYTNCLRRADGCGWLSKLLYTVKGHGDVSRCTDYLHIPFTEVLKFLQIWASLGIELER